jgi:5-methylcytosine-specific restriction endonuclease McrA
MSLSCIPQDIIRKVDERDKKTCVLCGKKDVIHRHHIYSRNALIPMYHEIPQCKKNNHEWNIITLCSECHWKIHNGMLKIPKDDLIKLAKRKPQNPAGKEMNFSGNARWL